MSHKEQQKVDTGVIAKAKNVRSMVVYIYNSFDDPLFKGILLPFMEHAASEQPDLHFHLITYEQHDWPLTEAQRAEIRTVLSRYNIEWYPLVWHSGNFKIVKKAYDLLIGFFLVLKLRLFGKIGSIGGLGTISGSFAFIIAKLLGLKFFGFWHEPHSEFMRDFNIWPINSVAYRGLNYMEKISGRYADVLTTGTDHMINRLKASGSQAALFKLPSCVNENRFRFNQAGRDRVRNLLPVNDNTPVILYLGKFGGIYYDQEIGVLFSELHKLNSNLFFFIVSPDAVDHITEVMTQAGVPQTHYSIKRSPYSEVQDYISAADFGIVAIPALSAQKYRSPIKVGEYLCCGLPYLVCRGVSEDDTVAEQYNVGVTVADFSESEIRKAYPAIEQFLTEDRVPLRNRCREAGIQYRGISNYLPVAEQIFSRVSAT
ncbi:glycosyltransferase family protein [Hymenobacter puniceus]|uniref:hypothetical protein n=1 Tax=Hymenobacter sp. BT190 TaxID=2763505 RepID=UPI0016512D9E|nr:hypothetical protein [Hymenobacter sp. BT190]MBC6697797.1 hypothetical protein [Hymenobacter sp. BT190]